MKSENKSWKKSGENVIAKDMFCYHGNREGNRGKMVIIPILLLKTKEYADSSKLEVDDICIFRQFNKE